MSAEILSPSDPATLPIVGDADAMTNVGSSGSTAASPDRRGGAAWVGDTLVAALGVMLVMTILQRGLGFARGLWFCRLMDDVDVGRWSLAYDFVVMMTPVAMLGIPGCLARFVEYFRIRGVLRPMVWHTAVATAVLGLAWSASVFFGRGQFGRLIFLDSGATRWVTPVAAAVAAIVAFNYVYELCVSLRRAKVASTMQFIQSVGFSIVGVIVLYSGMHPSTLVWVFGGCTLAGLLPRRGDVCPRPPAGQRPARFG